MESANPKSVRQVLEQSHRVGVQFLPADMAAAVTFLNVAEVTQSEDSCKRNRQNALSAYQTVVRLLPRVIPSDDEQLILDEKLCELGNRLVELKLPIHPSNIEPSPGKKLHGPRSAMRM